MGHFLLGLLAGAAMVSGLGYYAPETLTGASGAETECFQRTASEARATCLGEIRRDPYQYCGDYGDYICEDWCTDNGYRRRRRRR